ncbi:MAG: DUF4430 domain-containing protein [Clostridia bacterium]|nr:DUF4430 domain-containing protein [Clostridia bacterium]
MKRKRISFLSLICVSLFTIAIFVGCKKEPVTLDGDFIVITADEGAEGKTLLTYMQELKEQEKLSFELANGMVTSINGKANAADFSSCWMLYTSDSENANEAWGVVEYEEKSYGSATLGAESLIVKTGEIYIWWYQSF